MAIDIDGLAVLHAIAENPLAFPSDQADPVPGAMVLDLGEPRF